jgi:hypothetical protein
MLVEFEGKKNFFHVKKKSEFLFRVKKRLIPPHRPKNYMFSAVTKSDFRQLPCFSFFF